ncbi:MAG: hypothetical protein WCA13_08740 [Terriglobales bacterium]
MVRIQRDPEGNRIREDYFTVGGTLTRYELYSYSPDHVEDTHYTAEGKKTRYDVFYYSAKDTLTLLSSRPRNGDRESVLYPHWLIGRAGSSTDTFGRTLLTVERS